MKALRKNQERLRLSPAEEVQLAALQNPDAPAPPRFKWDVHYQQGILALILGDAQFLALAASHVQPAYFTERAHSEICRIVFEQFRETAKRPSTVVIAEELRRRFADPATLLRFAGELEACSQLASLHLDSREHCERSIIRFAQEQEALTAVGRFLDFEEKGEVDDIGEYWQQTAERIRALGSQTADVDLIGLDEIKALAARNRPHWIIDKILPSGSGEVIMPCSLPWGGKSTLVACALAKIGQGLDFFGYPTQRCPMVYINADRNSYDLFWERLAPFIEGERGEALLRECLLAPRFETLQTPLPDNYLDRCLRQAKAALDRIPAEHGLVVIDTMRAAFISGMGDNSENDAAAIMRFMPRLKRFALESRWAVMLIHHNHRAGDDYAGSAAIAGQVDVFWRIRRDKGSNIADIDFETRRGYARSIKVARNEDGLLTRYEPVDGESRLLHDFINLFPHYPASLSKEEAGKLPFVVEQGWASKTLGKYLTEAQRRDKDKDTYPRLILTGSARSTRYAKLTKSLGDGEARSIDASISSLP